MKKINVANAALKAIFRGVFRSGKWRRYSSYTMRNAIAAAIGEKISATIRKMLAIVYPRNVRAMLFWMSIAA